MGEKPTIISNIERACRGQKFCRAYHASCILNLYMVHGESDKDPGIELKFLSLILNLKECFYCGFLKDFFVFKGRNLCKKSNIKYSNTKLSCGNKNI